MDFLSRALKRLDLPLLLSIFGLLVLSLTTLYSGALNDPAHGIFWEQVVFVVIGGGVMFLFAHLDYHLLTKSSRFAYVAVILLLVLTLLLGPEIRGAHRWLVLGPVRLQVSELTKLVVILGLARWLYLSRGGINAWSVLLRTALFVGLPAVLVAAQPDMGSSLMLFSVWMGLLLISQAKTKLIWFVVLSSMVLAGITWQYALHDFQRDRITGFLNPSHDVAGRNYNVRQAIIAVGSGGWFGAGLGQGLQSQLRFLPERHTDFIFASMAEELGFVGGGVLIILYAGLLSRMWVVAWRARDNLGSYVVLGVWWLVFAEGSVNLAMNMGLLPVTGIPLPLVSAGGSSTITFMAALGIVSNVHWQSRSLRF